MFAQATSPPMPKPSVATLLTAGAFVLVLFGARARTTTYRSGATSS
jgi:hypothetical protein